MNLIMMWLIFLTINRYQIRKNKKVNSRCGYPKSESEPVVTVPVPKIVKTEPVALVLVSVPKSGELV